jgi:alpha-glucosidase
VQYARGKNVKIWIWLHHDDVARQMDEAFSLYENWGVAGVKVDFIERDDQAGIDFYYRVAEKAAQHHLMVDFHGATKPWGIERTFPNVLGYEAVLGMEQSKAGGRDNPDHRATIPFTRMLGGLMDYTPGGFSNVTEDEFIPRSKRPLVMGTRAQQLAMYAIYEAPIQMVSDSPKSYNDQPAFEFIEHAPATWDDTRVLGGEPGEYIVMARRSGKEWFVGSLTNRSGRDIDVPLDFLGPGKYQALIYADAADADRYPKNVAITRRPVDQTMHLKARLAPGGGYAVRIIPLP